VSASPKVSIYLDQVAVVMIPRRRNILSKKRRRRDILSPTHNHVLLSQALTSNAVSHGVHLW
jgi:hypothetical protein